MQSIWLIFQLLFCLWLGFILANRLHINIKKLIFKILPWFGYLLLTVISIELSQTLGQIPHPEKLLTNAIYLAIFTTLGTFFCCYVLFRVFDSTTLHGKVSLKLLIQSLINISYAFIALAIGFLLNLLLQHLHIQVHISSWYLLLIFMFVIGVDLAFSPLDRSWLNWKMLLVPMGCVVGSIAGAFISTFFIHNIQIKDLIMLSQGYGFYSMTGIVITELKNAELGSIALMNDLFREIFSILLMYAIGWRYPKSAISAAGATAMDATLPMVKQACGNQFIPHAIVSGFVLTLLAPVVISIMASF